MSEFPVDTHKRVWAEIGITTMGDVYVYFRGKIFNLNFTEECRRMRKHVVEQLKRER